MAANAGAARGDDKEKFFMLSKQAMGTEGSDMLYPDFSPNMSGM